ncbi:DASH complex subunit Dad2-domain-containing protein [Annulohypoxylon truncatum]|uniref:DASH complex subunit Dad2-domain-containing protein n=1 Tax=Annulohypoxylon truncatum TaxID=327061 RepID=UPI002007DAB5|nr:DASH complex subunit Dad2-domain-containing protein [Annulohypoxylon truncatum]KAI1210397.1 DASH complex subunit Dad2-domain-containing protein [Annulohypoxylon truncatum]
MAFSSRGIPSHLRQASTSGNPGAQSTGQSPALVARVNEKKAELENLKELRDLSAAVANQMEALEQKLATLSDGTEAIATVVSNWHNVLRAINMASTKIPTPRNVEDEGETKTQDTLPLPQTLVRIPTEHAPALQAQAEAIAENENNSSSLS